MNYVKGPLKIKGGASSKDLIQNANNSNKLLDKRKRPESPENDKITKSLPVSTKAEATFPNPKQGKKEIKKTEYEKKVEIHKQKRILERIDKKLKTSHREKVEEFNKTLNKLPEHFDIPRVGPG